MAIHKLLKSLRPQNSRHFAAFWMISTNQDAIFLAAGVGSAFVKFPLKFLPVPIPLTLAAKCKCEPSHNVLGGFAAASASPLTMC